MVAPAHASGAHSVERTGRSDRRRFGKYRLIAQLGEGGMARVSLAYTRGPGGFVKLLVVKSMKENLTDQLFYRSFMHEARLAAQLSHPNIVQTYEVGEDRGRYYIAMEYLEGQTLRAVTRRMAPERLPLPVQLRILIETARALHFAHNATSFDGAPLGIVHRDVSPQNVVLTYTGQVKLLDFGIAKAHSADELTRAGMVKGKIDYMAPEQLRGDAIDHRADIFALGVMLWEAASGRRFSGGAEVAEVTKMHNRVMGKELKLRDVAPTTPMRIVEICERALALEAEDRYGSAEEFAEDLANYLADTTRNTDARQLAEIIHPLFKEEQQRIRDAIEQHIRGVDDDDDPDADADDWDPDASLPHLSQTAWTGTDGSDPSLLDVVELDRQRAAAAGQKQSKGRGGLVFIGMLAVAVVAGALIAVYQPNGDAGTREATASSPPVAPVPASTGQLRGTAGRVEVRINVVPDTAVAELDGAPVALPFQAHLEADGALHRLSARAEGYLPQERVFTFDHDVELALVLDPAPEPQEEEPEEDPRANMRYRRPRGGSRGGTGNSTAAADTMSPPPPSETMSAETSSDMSGDESMSSIRVRRPGIVSDNPYGD